jgi:hypothetical protein
MSKPIGREEGHDRRGHHAIDHHRAHRYSGPPLGVVPPRCTTPASRNGVSGNWLEEPRPSSRRKYAPSLPFRAFLPRPARHLPKALDASLTRLGRSSVDLYQIHYPVPDLQRRPYEPSRRQRRGGQDPSGRRIQLLRPTTAGSLRAAAGPRHHTGVNQVQYSLLHDKPKVDGVLQACRELGVTLIAYMPLAMGALSGKYRPGAKPSDWMRRRIGKSRRGSCPNRCGAAVGWGVPLIQSRVSHPAPQRQTPPHRRRKNPRRHPRPLDRRRPRHPRPGHHHRRNPQSPHARPHPRLPAHRPPQRTHQTCIAKQAEPLQVRPVSDLLRDHMVDLIVATLNTSPQVDGLLGCLSGPLPSDGGDSGPSCRDASAADAGFTSIGPRRPPRPINQRLSPQTRSDLVSAFFAGANQGDLATEYGISVRSVKRIVHAARAARIPDSTEEKRRSATSRRGLVAEQGTIVAASLAGHYRDACHCNHENDHEDAGAGGPSVAASRQLDRPPHILQNPADRGPGHIHRFTSSVHVFTVAHTVRISPQPMPTQTIDSDP